MPASFTHQLSVQLAEVSALRVKDAEHNEIVQPGTIYVCPGSHHLRFSSSGRIALDDGSDASAAIAPARTSLSRSAAQLSRRR